MLLFVTLITTQCHELQDPDVSHRGPPASQNYFSESPEIGKHEDWVSFWSITDSGDHLILHPGNSTHKTPNTHIICTHTQTNKQKQNYSPLECYFHHFLGCHPPTWQAARVSISEMYYLGKCKKVRKESERMKGKDQEKISWGLCEQVKNT